MVTSRGLDGAGRHLGWASRARSQLGACWRGPDMGYLPCPRRLFSLSLGSAQPKAKWRNFQRRAPGSNGPAPHPSPLPSHPWPLAEASFVIPPPNPSFQPCSHHRLLGAPVLQHPAPHPAPKASSQGPGGWVHRLAKQTYPGAPESRLDLPRRGVAVSSSCSAWPVQPHAGTQTQSPGCLEQLLPKGRGCISSLGLHRPPVTGLSQPIPQAQCGSEPPRGTRSFNPRQGPYFPLCTDGCVRHQEATYALQGGRKFIPNPCVWPPLSRHPGPLVNPQRPSLAR